MLEHVNPPPTFTQFRERLETEFGCQFRVIPPAATDELPVHEIARVVGTEPKEYYLVIVDERLTMAPTVVRSICRYLEIGEDAFPMTELEGD